MENKQTAVEWLIKEIESLITIETFQRWKVLKEQAKQMEKEQLDNARPQIVSNCVIKEISDEKIEKAKEYHWSYRNGFVEGAKWYREQLKKNI